jgi:hypothetical protein
MSQFISLRILASLALGRSKKTSNRETPRAPAVAERRNDSTAAERQEPGSSSRMRIASIRIIEG